MSNFLKNKLFLRGVTITPTPFSKGGADCAPDSNLSLNLASDEKGATMVEFALSLILFLAILAVIIDGGVGIWRYSILTETVNLVTVDRSIHLTQPWGLARELGATAACNSGCQESDIIACAEEIAETRISSFTSLDPTQFTFSVDALSFDSVGVGRLTLNATWNTPTFLAVLIGFNEFAISTSGTTAIEISQDIADGRCGGTMFTTN